MLQSPLDIDIAILMIFYHFSDQYGRVDMPAARSWADKKLGIILKDREFQLNQEHLNLLMDQDVIVNTKDMMSKITDTTEPTRFFL